MLDRTLSQTEILALFIAVVVMVGVALFIAWKWWVAGHEEDDDG